MNRFFGKLAGSRRSGLKIATTGAIAGVLTGAVFGQQAPLKPFGVDVLPVLAKSTNLGLLPGNTVLQVTVSLNPANPGALQAFADSVSNPTSPNYQHFLTPAQFGQQFGASQTSINQVVSYLKQKGFTVKQVSPNNLVITVQGTVTQAESAFNTTISQYHSSVDNPGGRSDFYAFDRPLQLPTTIAPAVLAVSGLQNWTKPIPRHHVHIKPPVPSFAAMLFGKQGGTQCLTPTQTRVLYDTAPIYNASMTGTGRTVGISSFDGFRLSNVPLYYSQYNLAKPSGGVGTNITVTAVDGGSGAGSPSGEGDLDIQMVLGMAPTCSLIVYDGGGALIDVLNQEANDNSADIITESYGWELSATDSEACHNVHLQMTTQGITYMEATGDYGTTLEPYSYSNYDPEVFQVGGSVATVSSTGARVSEVGWSGSGGGWATDVVPFNVLPSWQKGKGVPTSINFRLNPDVALNAAGNPGAYYFYLNGALTSDYDGTSFASPVFAGSLGVSEQKLVSLGDITVSNGKYRLGRIQDLVYQQNGRSDVYYDITSGSNGTLPNGQTSNAGLFWDFVTGWGSVDFNAFVATFKPTGNSSTVTAATVGVYAGQGGSVVGGPAQLASIDQQYYKEGSVTTSNGQVAAAVMGFQLVKPVTSLTTLTLKLVESGPQGSTNFVYLHNYVTNNFDLVSTSPNTGLDTTVSIPITNFANYISSTGALQVVDRALVPPRVVLAQYALKLDYAAMVGVFTN